MDIEEIGEKILSNIISDKHNYFYLFRNNDIFYQIVVNKTKYGFNSSIININDDVKTCKFFNKFNYLDLNKLIHEIKNKLNGLSMIEQLLALNDNEDITIIKSFKDILNDINELNNNLYSVVNQYNFDNISLFKLIKFHFQISKTLIIDKNLEFKITNSLKLINLIFEQFENINIRELQLIFIIENINLIKYLKIYDLNKKLILCEDLTNYIL
jgi:hypothetical protein